MGRPRCFCFEHAQVAATLGLLVARFGVTCIGLGHGLTWQPPPKKKEVDSRASEPYLEGHYVAIDAKPLSSRSSSRLLLEMLARCDRLTAIRKKITKAPSARAGGAFFLENPP